MSTQTTPQPTLADAILGVRSVLEEGHTVLSSGRHSNARLNLEYLLGSAVMERVNEGLTAIFRKLKIVTVVPVPEGALKLANDKLASQLTVVRSRKNEQDRHNFIFSRQQEQLIKKASRLAILEDVVTTGKTPAAMARIIREEIVPEQEAEIHLVAVWRRGEVLPKYGGLFNSQRFLVEQPLPDWPAEECRICDAA